MANKAGNGGMSMAAGWDVAAFVRPVAHRGLHGPVTGFLENSAAAFEAAVNAGVALECDLQPSRDGIAMVHHDDTLARLFGDDRRLRDVTSQELRRMRYPGLAQPLLALADLLALVVGRQPVLIEIKSDWRLPDKAYLAGIAAELRGYGPGAALMSFDPAVIAVLRELAPEIPRGIVAQSPAGYRTAAPERAYALGELLETGPAAPDFIAYEVGALPTPVTRYVREVQRLPLFAWTVRTKAEHETARDWADAPIFEETAA